MSKLLLIDGYAILHRAFHALPPLTNKRGQMVNAIYGFVSMLLKLIVDLKPTHIIITFDREEPTFRKKKHKAYQSHRKPIDEGLVAQFTMARDLAKAMQIPSYEKAGFESDDLIGTISNKAKIDSVVIVTGDRDLFQLVNDRVKIFMPSRGVVDGKIYGRAEVSEKMGVPPSQIVEYKALVGDASDNYPGVAGIGPKTAINLLKQYKDVKGVYEHLKDIPDATKNKLIKNKKNAELSHELAKIITDVDIKFDLNKAKNWDLDSPEVLKLFKFFSFNTLTQRVKKVGKMLDEEKQEKLF